MPNLQATPVVPLLKGKFRVLVGGENYGDFVTAGPILESESTVAEIQSGESNVVASQSASKVKFSPVTLTQGAALNSKMAQWRARVVDQSAIGGGEDADYKEIMTIQQLNHGGTPVKSFKHFEAFPSKFSNGDFDGASGEYRMESVTITFRYGNEEVI